MMLWFGLGLQDQDLVVHWFFIFFPKWCTSHSKKKKKKNVMDGKTSKQGNKQQKAWQHLSRSVSVVESNNCCQSKISLCVGTKNKYLTFLFFNFKPFFFFNTTEFFFLFFWYFHLLEIQKVQSLRSKNQRNSSEVIY